MHTLYPEITPRQHWMLAVGNGHELYVEEMGNPEGLPVLVLHGGPGAGCSPDSRRFFDPHVYRIVCFDQRGAGRSRPRGGLTANTTGHLLDDIELILAHLAIKRVTLFGGSWGATLALLFAIRHPMTVLGCILRGTFLGRPQDIDWLYQRGASDIYPSAWRDFLVPLTPQECADPIAGYTRIFSEATPFIRYQAARAWNLWETRLASRQPDLGSITDGSPSHDLAFATIEHHYVAHQCFIAPNAILDQAEMLATVPVELVHGVEDHVCPLAEARLLHASLRDARLTVIADGGHSARHQAMISALVEATRLMAARYGHGRDVRRK